MKLTRREFLEKIVRNGPPLLAGGYLLNPLFHELSNGLFGASDVRAQNKKGNPNSELEKTQDSLLKTVENQNGDAIRKIDYLGSGNFAAGVGSTLMHNTPHPMHYATAIACWIAKYFLSDEAGKHYLVHQFYDGYNAMRVILGTTILGGGVEFNLDTITKNLYNRASTKEEKIFTSIIIPMLTGMGSKTVGSARIFRQPISDLVNTILEERNDQETEAEIKGRIYADNIGHIANNTGYVLVGDPPFVAMLQKYGIEGFKFQNKTMWPLMLCSTLTTAIKMSRFVGNDDKISLEDTLNLLGSQDNWNLFSKIVKETIINAYRCLTLDNQSEMGIIMHPLDEMKKEIHNTHRLIRGDYTVHEVHGMEAALEELERIKRFAEDLKKLEGIKCNNPIDAFKKAFEYLQKLEWYNSLRHKLERAYGPNLTDVITVFTFQAVSIPFLVTVFKDYLDSLKNLPEKVKDTIVYLSIAAFSSVADNYIACKLGLEVYPHKPEIPFIASIVGGSMLPCGNMSNITLVSLKEHSLIDGLRTAHRHLDMLGIGLAYAEAIPYLEKMPILGKLYSKSGITEALKNFK